MTHARLAGRDYDFKMKHLTVHPLRILLVTALSAASSAWGAPTSPTLNSVTPLPTSQPATVPAIPKDEIIAGFLKYVGSSDAYDAKAREFVIKSRGKARPEGLHDFLNNSLGVLSEPFKIALDLVAAEQSDKAADIFDALSMDDDPYLAVASAILGATAFIELDKTDEALTTLDRVHKAHEPVERYTLDYDHYLFMLGYCEVHDLQYDAAQVTLTEFLTRYPGAPDRLRVTATQIVTELSRRSPGGMGDVRDLLNYARRRISLKETGDAVTKRQKEAVELITAMIEDAENREKSKEKGGGGKKGGSRPQGTKPGGATRSTLPGGQSQIGELRKVRASPGEVWGKMPPREREEILQTLQRRFPSQYRDLLEQYYKQLAKDAPPK
jgi:tetratricopeptide (TPR) repeat protein